MKLSKEQAAANKQQIIETAVSSFKEHGVGAVGVSEIMKEAGFTHGGFYNHFESKEDLIAAAYAAAFEEGIAGVREVVKKGKLSSAIDNYLSVSQRDAPAKACPTAGLVTDAVRQNRQVRSAYTQGIADYVDAMQEKMKGASASVRRHKAMSTLAMMVGAMTMARAIGDANEELSVDFLDAAKAAIRGSVK